LCSVDLQVVKDCTILIAPVELLTQPYNVVAGGTISLAEAAVG
jgi:hypothetical protein